MPRYGLLVIACLAVVVFAKGTAPAAANASQCYQIQDRDHKNFCLAQANGQASYCYQIQDRDLKNVCLAQTQGAAVVLLSDSGQGPEEPVPVPLLIGPVRLPWL